MTTAADAADTAAPLRIEGLGVRYPARREPSLSGVDLTVAAGSQVGVAGRTGAGKSTLALAAAGFIPRVVRAKARRPGRHRGGRRRDRVGRRAARPGRDRLLDAGQPAVRLEAVGPRGARVRPREPGRAPGRDGRPDRRHAGPPVHRPPRRSRAVRPVRWRAAAGGHRQHRGHGHVRPRSSTSRPRSSIRRARRASPTCWRSWPGVGRPSCAWSTTRACSAGWIAASSSMAAGPSRSGVPGAALAEAASVASLPAPTLVRLAQAAGIDLAQAFDEAAIAAGLAARRGGREPDRDDTAPRPRRAPRPTRPPRRPRTRRPPGRRRAAGHRSASRSRTSSTATRPGSRPSAASRSRSSRARRSRSSARTARARRPS